MTKADRIELIVIAIGVVSLFVLGFVVHAFLFSEDQSVTILDAYTGVDEILDSIAQVDSTGDTVGYMTFRDGRIALYRRDTTVVRAVMLRIGGDTVLLGIGQSYGAR